MIRSEDDLHLLIGNYLNINEPNLKKKGLIYWTYSPAGELRNKLIAIKLKNKLLLESLAGLSNMLNKSVARPDKCLLNSSM